MLWDAKLERASGTLITNSHLNRRYAVSRRPDSSSEIRTTNRLLASLHWAIAFRANPRLTPTLEEG